MMMIFTWLLTFALVLDCLLLGLLVLIQLPKKEAGMGQAFGGATTDALFGAGSGTALTKMTKYSAGAFFVLILMLAVLHGRVGRTKTGDLRTILKPEDRVSQTAPVAKPNTNAAAAATALSDATNRINLSVTSNPAPPTTNAVEKPAK
jgi:protein translocase SecG subunit